MKSSYDGEPITQKKLAYLVGMPTSRITKLEAGAIIPRIEWVEELARFFSYDSDKLYLMIWELPPDMHWFLCGTKQGEKLVENIRKVMEKLPDPEARADTQKYRTNSEKDGHDHARYNYFSRMDDRITEQKLSRKD